MLYTRLDVRNVMLYTTRLDVYDVRLYPRFGVQFPISFSSFVSKHFEFFRTLIIRLSFCPIGDINWITCLTHLQIIESTFTTDTDSYFVLIFVLEKIVKKIRIKQGY